MVRLPLTVHSVRIMLLSLTVVAISVAASAEEPVQQFSLGGGKLTMAPDDAKAPDPGIVTARYGFRVAKDFLPYFGTGVAYSYQPDAKNGDITRLKTGLAAQFGFNFNLGNNSTLKLDYKYLAITPDLPRGDTRTPPQSFGLGIDIRF